MSGFDLGELPEEQRPTAAWAAALLQALARDEAAGRRPERLTEPRMATWNRFKGRLASDDFVELLFEDAAVLHPIPFNASVLGNPIRFDRLTESVAERWLELVPALDLKGTGGMYVEEQARMLGLPTRMARTDLHVVKPHQKVLELPGSGGQLAHYLASTHPDLKLHDNFVVACSSWQELTLAGVVAVELGAPHSDFIMRIGPDDLLQADHALRKRSFDFVIGLHPDKGGQFRVADQLAIWFPNAKVLLV